MSEQQVDNGKRRFLIAATTAVGGVAGVAVLAPFVMSMMPSQRAKAAGAPVEIDISKIEPGMLLAVAWQGKPVWVVNRTKAMLASLPGNDSRLVDPKSLEDQQPPYAKNETRSVKPEYLVVVPILQRLLAWHSIGLASSAFARHY